MKRSTKSVSRPKGGEYLRGEEVGGDQGVLVRGDEVGPRDLGLATGRGRDAKVAGHIGLPSSPPPLGSGMYRTFTEPTPVTGITDAVRLETFMEAQHTCAILGDGTARCWGRNVTGTLGNGDPTTSLAPVEPDGL